MLKVLFQVFDFLVKAVIEFAQTEQGKAEFDDIQRELIALGVPIDADDIGAGEVGGLSTQMDMFDDVEWLAQLNGLTPTEQGAIMDVMRRGGGVTPAIEVDERLTAQEFSPVKDPARFVKGQR